MDTRRLGRTNHASSVAIAGGITFHFLEGDAIAAYMDELLAAGVNHLDIAPGYLSAEEKAGTVLPAVRDRLFVGCKTGQPDRDGAWEELERSLGRLGCERFDLYQLHGVTSVDDLDARAGAVLALREAQEQGLTSYVGITGHGLGAPAAHAEAVRRHDLDTVMFPVNARMWAEPDYRRDAEALLELCAARDVGVMAIKAAAARPWAGREQTSTTWYEPHTEVDAIDAAVRFTLSTAGVTGFCTPGDLEVCRMSLAAAARFEPLDETAYESAIAAASAAGDALIF